MRDKFVYSCSIKICASGFNKLFPRVLLVKHWDAWRSGCQLMKGQVSMVDTTKLLSPIHSSFAAWVVQYAVRHCRGEELGPFCWPMLAAGFAVFVHLINLLSILLRCNGFSGIQKAIVDQMGSRPPVTMTFFWCKFGFGKCFGALSQSSHWAWRRQWHPTPVLLPGKSHGRRSLVGYSPWGR